MQTENTSQNMSKLNNIFNSQNNNSRDNYSRNNNSRDNYSRDNYSRDNYSRDNYSRDNYSRDNYSRDNYSRNNNSRDNYSRNNNSRDNNEEINTNNKEEKIAEEKIAEEEIADEEIVSIEKWDELNIKPELLRGIYTYGFETPSSIQKKAIIPIIKGRDIIAQAQSGTGKTAAFSIGALERVDLNNNSTQVLILSPTHELTKQTAKVIVDLSNSMKGIKINTIVGGTSVDMDIEQLKNDPPHIIVGCPGRVFDMIRRRAINVSSIKLMVLDEADEMLSSGFKELIQDIFSFLNEKTQIALFSATLPQNIIQMTSNFMHKPVKIIVKKENLTLEGIEQYYVAVEDDNQKYNTLKDIYEVISLSQCIIYANSINRVEDLYQGMKEDGFPVCCIHSGMSKDSRLRAITEFKSGMARVLISSNVTARGIDVQQVSVVINFDIPRDVSTYIHRIGRSGRWGRKGTGINFVSRRDIDKLKEIEQFYCTQIEPLPTNF